MLIIQYESRNDLPKLGGLQVFRNFVFDLVIKINDL